MNFLIEETKQNNIAIILKLMDGNLILDTYFIEYPECGFGGCDLIESPDHSMVVLGLYSGSSDYAFKLFKASGDILELINEEDYSYGDAYYMWSSDNKKLYQIVDSYLYMNVTDKDIYCVGKLNIFDIVGSHKETKEIFYNFADYDLCDLDFFRMSFGTIDNKPCVVMPNNVIMNIEV